MNIGVEKEGLRVTPSGKIASTPHPEVLGATLTHPFITTDYSEALLEFITPVLGDSEAVLTYLDQLHQWALMGMGQEVIWPCSMPCRIDHELDVPIAEYGTSNIGRLKQVYRHGLWHRYGRIMQCIAGIHYNVSLNDGFWQQLPQAAGIDSSVLKDIKTQQYFGIIRNFRRYSWLLMYLFGASPCVDASFLEAYPHKRSSLERLDADTYYGPNATSLRMSDLGYQSAAQAGLFVCYNRLDTYLQTLKQGITTPYPAYEAIGVQSPDGEYQQMSTHILQIENEYYGDIRPKRTTLSGEKPLHALDSRGVEYIEVRSLDLNPYAANGLSVDQMHFLELFMQFCALKDSPLMDQAECDQAQSNLNLVVNQGRKPDLRLGNAQDEVLMRDWASQLMSEIFLLARCLDKQQGTDSRQQAVSQQQRLLDNVELTLSARILSDCRQATGGGFIAFGQKQAERFSGSHDALDAQIIRQFEQLSIDTLSQKNSLETSSTIEFGAFLRDYLAGF